MMSAFKRTAAATLSCALLILTPQTWAATVEYELSIDWQSINVTGKPAQGMTINGGIPGPR